jgi:uncharacterized protein YciI
METEYFVFIHRPGPAWIPDAPVLDQPLEGHFAYMTGLEESGILVLGGGFLDGAGAMGILRCPSLGEAHAIALRDPAVVDRVVLTEVHPWFPTVGGSIEAG